MLKANIYRAHLIFVFCSLAMVWHGSARSAETQTVINSEMIPSEWTEISQMNGGAEFTLIRVGADIYSIAPEFDITVDQFTKTDRDKQIEILFAQVIAALWFYRDQYRQLESSPVDDRKVVALWKCKIIYDNYIIRDKFTPAFAGLLDKVSQAASSRKDVKLSVIFQEAFTATFETELDGIENLLEAEFNRKE